MLSYANFGCLPEIGSKVVDMALNGSGIRDTACVLDVAPPTVIKELKKKGPELENVNYNILNGIKNHKHIQIVIKSLR